MSNLAFEFLLALFLNPMGRLKGLKKVRTGKNQTCD